MKKIISTFLLCVLVVGCVFSMASCSKVSESYAKKINEAADKKENYTYTEVLEDLGDEAIDFTTGGLSADYAVGVVIAVKGCENWDEIEDKLDNDETVKGIVITIVAGKATKAEYREITENDKK